MFYHRRAVDKIIIMQRDSLHLEEAFPVAFNNSEDEIVTSGEWDELKNTGLYRKLMNGNKFRT